MNYHTKTYPVITPHLMPLTGLPLQHSQRFDCSSTTAPSRLQHPLDLLSPPTTPLASLPQQTESHIRSITFPAARLRGTKHSASVSARLRSTQSKSSVEVSDEDDATDDDYDDDCEKADEQDSTFDGESETRDHVVSKPRLTKAKSRPILWPLDQADAIIWAGKNAGRKAATILAEVQAKTNVEYNLKTITTRAIRIGKFLDARKARSENQEVEEFTKSEVGSFFSTSETILTIFEDGILGKDCTRS